MKHFLRFQDLSKDEFDHLFERTRILKYRFKNYIPYQPLVDRMLAMVFEKSSTRTRVSFEAGIHQLGGSSIVLNTAESQLGRGEPIEDVSRIITRMVDIVMIRTFDQNIIERFAEHSRVPVINGLTNQYHPCQILADLYTYIEHRGSIAGKSVAWIGDANNMCTTWAEAARIFGFKLRVASPEGYRFTPGEAEAPFVELVHDPRAACEGVDLVTTDVWTSMGYEAENAARLKAFAGYTVDEAMMKAAAKDALFMHCLPAHRGEEVTHEVLEGPQSVVWDEAENRLHVQKALMEYLLLGKINS